MKMCELCKSIAKTFCESDQASLCWSCDAKVHGANFLVARHSRTLLCHFCQSLTPWQAAGAKLGHTVSFCLRCANGDTHEARRGEEVEEESGSEESELDEEEEDEEDEEDGDNQVVPWSASATTPPPATSSSSSSASESDGGEYVESRKAVSVKRTRETDLLSLLEGDIVRRSDHCQSATRCHASESTSLDESVRPLKNRRIIRTAMLCCSGARSAAIEECLARLDPISQNRVRICDGEAMVAVDEGDEEVSSENLSRTI
ncbi:unnamed protein product [Linum trigynum]|uniref:B box-type domain-containing protein n=1 Tax=Linum trigynum TaxID=586398 RepID=A0AAV2GAN9_9ROSI